MPEESTVAVPTEATGDSIQLAEENRRLFEENRRLKHEEQRREVTCFLSELRNTGQLTPAMEQAGVEAALVAAGEQDIPVSFPDGKQMPLGSVLRQVLAALPISWQPGSTADVELEEVELTPEEQHIAAQLGLSAEEFTSIKAGC